MTLSCRRCPASRASTPILALPHTGEGISPALSNPVPEAESRKSGRRLGHVGGEQDVLAAFIAECCVDHRKHTNRDTFRTMPRTCTKRTRIGLATSALASADPHGFRSPARFSVTISRGRPNSRVISRHLAVARATFLHFACRTAQKSRPKLRKSPTAALQLFTKNAFCKEFLTPEKQAISAKVRIFDPNGGS